MNLKLTIVVVCVVALAGCSVGVDGDPPQVENVTGTASPADSETGTGENMTVEESPPGVEEGTVTNISALSSRYSQLITEGQTDFQVDVADGEREYRYAVQNDTTDQYYSILQAGSDSEYYITARGNDAKRDADSGSVEYSGPGNTLKVEAEANTQLARDYIGYIDYLNWSVSETRMTSDGEPRHVLTADSASPAASESPNVDTRGLERAEGRLVVGPSGAIYSGNVEFQSRNEDLTIEYGYTNSTGDIEAPEWFNPPE